MATFTTLPNEVLALILDKTYPEDLDSIVLAASVYTHLRTQE